MRNLDGAVHAKHQDTEVFADTVYQKQKILMCVLMNKKLDTFEWLCALREGKETTPH